MIKFNWKVRSKNPYFWIGLVSMALCAMNVEASMLTSWEILFEKIKELFSNPFLLGTVAVALFCYVQDFTTKGPGDSDIVMTYTEPRPDSNTVEDEDEEVE